MPNVRGGGMSGFSFGPHLGAIGSALPSAGVVSQLLSRGPSASAVVDAVDAQAQAASGVRGQKPRSQ